MTYGRVEVGGIGPNLTGRQISDGQNAGVYLSTLQYRASSKAKFPEHAKHCLPNAAVISQSKARIDVAGARRSTKVRSISRFANLDILGPLP